MKKTIIISLLVSLLPMSKIGAGLFWVVNKNATFEKYKPTKGEIIKINEDKVFDYPYKKRNFYYPTIMYYDDNGKSYTFTLKMDPKATRE